MRSDPDAVFVDHTTASAAAARELHHAARERGLHFIDAPVSGGQAGAQKGQLSVMCGGDADTLPNGSENNYVANNIVYDNITYGIIEVGKVGANNRYIDNLVYLSGTSVRAAGHISGTISADPEFVNYQADGTGDYRLRKSSPAMPASPK